MVHQTANRHCLSVRIEAALRSAACFPDIVTLLASIGHHYGALLLGRFLKSALAAAPI